MRMIGLVFVVLSAGTAGFQMAATLKNRCRMFTQLLDALQLMYNEIALCATPLPQTFALMAAETTDMLETLFSTVAKDMDKNRWVTPYEAVKAALADCPDKTLEELLLPLSKRIGKYDIQEQLRGIDDAKRQTQQLLQLLEQESRIKSRTYRTLGICAGLAAAILMA